MTPDGFGMTSDQLARALSEHAHEIAFEQREEFQRETQRIEAERAELQRHKRERKGQSNNPQGRKPMSTDPNKTDQQANGEEILKAMQATNGGTLERDDFGRLHLIHPPTPPAPSR